MTPASGHARRGNRYQITRGGHTIGRYGRCGGSQFGCLPWLLPSSARHCPINSTWPWTWAIALNAEGMFRDLLLGAIAMGTLCIADLLLGIVLPSDRQPRHQAVQVAALVLLLSSLTPTVIVAIRWGRFSGKHLDTDTVSHHVYAILALLGVGALAEVLVGVQE
jgi:hypothetical protein